MWLENLAAPPRAYRTRLSLLEAKTVAEYNIFPMLSQRLTLRNAL